MGGIGVSFAATNGGGNVTGATTTTNSLGVATVGGWTLGTTTGANTLTASSGALSAVTFAATGTAGPASSVVKTSGDGQTAVAGAAVAVPPSITVKDANGNPAGGVAVTFVVASGGGSVTGGSQTTNSAGVATVGSWVLGPTVVSNSLTATAASLTSLTFTASGVVGPAASLSNTAGDNQTARAGNPISTAPSVTVRDANGNLVSGAAVTFAVGSGGGSVTGASTTSNSSGVATVGGWTLGFAGPNTLTASAGGSASATFNATAEDNCLYRDTHNAGTTTTGTLTQFDCKLPAGSLTDLYQMALPSAGAYRFTETSTDFDSYFLLLAGDMTPVAENDDATPTTHDASVKILLAASPNYVLAPSTLPPPTTGSYSVTSVALTSPDITHCEQAFIVKGVSTSQTLATTDCVDPTGPFYIDNVLIYLRAGQTITISMSSSVFDTYLLLKDPQGGPASSNHNNIPPNHNSQIVYQAVISGYFTIQATSVAASATGSYLLTLP
jgi:hypothetical protein